MSEREPAGTSSRGARWTILTVLVVVTAAVIGMLRHEMSAYPSTSSSSDAPTSTQSSPASPAKPPLGSTSTMQRARTGSPGAASGATGEADGKLPQGVTIFDDQYPGVRNVNPALLAALRRAATAAGRSGITFYVNSGWRSPKYQQQLLLEAIAKYGSEKAAERWVATPDTSAHVSGDAVDIGRSDADSWLSRHGSAYGLCQIYRNEIWHFELRPEAIVHGCPTMYADPTQDPRMQQ